MKERRWKSMAIVALGAGVLLTALAVAIGGLALEMVLFLMSRNCAKLAESTNGRGAPSTVIHLKGNGKSIGAMEWAEEAAAWAPLTF
jgi:hypothetical protein